MNIYSKETIYFPMGGMGDEANWRNSTTTISGKTLLYNYIGTIPNPLYVPKIVGRAVINDWYNTSTSGTTESNRNTPFYNNPNIISVDLQEVPFRNNSMHNAFYNCQNLVSIKNISSSVTNMSSAFFNCYNLNQNIQIPSSVTSMSSTFYWCKNLNQNIRIPNSVTSMYRTFSSCNNLNQNIQIPSSVTNMSQTFSSCYNLNQNIQIPSSVTNMSSTFYWCNNLNQNIQIPSSATNMNHVFYNCFKLKSRITIASPNVSDTTNCFYNVTNANVVFPLRYINNVNSATRNSLVTAGYAVGTAVGNYVSNTTQNTWFYAWDSVGGDYNTYTGNGTHWILSKWNGKMATWFNGGSAVYDVVVPSTISGYPTALDFTCFNSNAALANLETS